MIIIKKCSQTKARTGKIKTLHGEVNTPVFMPVATQGTVKTLSNDELQKMNVEMFVSNTYHLYLRPGVDVIKAAGGLHKFTGWKGAILTDSGGFQVYSMSKIRKINEEGVQFQSHIDGSNHFFTPELAIQLQIALGSDILMCFDECAPYPCQYDYAKQSMEMTLRWAKRCKDEFAKSIRHTGNGPFSTFLPPLLFGITQGSTYTDLRIESAKRTVDLNFDGYAIGGLAVGEPEDVTTELIRAVCSVLPEDKPRYAMGVGSIRQIWECVENGIDIFDCVLPTRNGRNGQAFTFSGKINLKNSKYQDDFEPPEPGCNCPVCSQYSRGYVHHLFKSGELLSLRLLSLHNLCFMIKLFKFIRKSIVEGKFSESKKEFFSKYVEE
ncbi:MAG: tRNA guanosine(34) transglycosylase Tgt [Elusimicrobiota bacterium]